MLLRLDKKLSYAKYLKLTIVMAEVSSQASHQSFHAREDARVSRLSKIKTIPYIRIILIDRLWTSPDHKIFYK